MKDSIYISRAVENKNDIIEWFEKQGVFFNIEDELHVTQVYSTAPVDISTLELDKSPLILTRENSKREIEFFGDYIVMLVDNNPMNKRFSYFSQKGCSWDFPEYNSHISISKDASQFKKEDIIPYQGEIYLGPEIIEKLNLDQDIKPEEDTSTTFSM